MGIKKMAVLSALFGTAFATLAPVLVALFQLSYTGQQQIFAWAKGDVSIGPTVLLGFIGAICLVVGACVNHEWKE